MNTEPKETPLTDAAEKKQEDAAEYIAHLVPASFARTLETTAETLRARVAELEADLQAAKNRDAYRENLVTELRDERDSLRSQLAAAKADWQPIATAPKDGTRVLIHRKGRTSIGWWNDERHHAKPHPHWDGDDARIYGTRWARSTTAEGWLPLPPAPTAARAQRKRNEG